MRRHLPQMVATGRTTARRWLAARACGLGKVSLGVLLPLVVAGLMFGATCGAPDEVRRGQAQSTGGGIGGAGGNSSSPSGGTTASNGGSTTIPPQGGSTTPSGGSSSGGAEGGSGAGGTITSGGKTATGGRTATGGTSATGGRSATGGTVTGGVATGGAATGGAVTGGRSGTGGVTSPFGGNGGAGGTLVGGRGGSGGATSPSGGSGGTAGATGGIGGRGGTSGSGGATSTVPTSGLAAYVVTKAAGSPGQISLSLQIANTTAQSVDMSTVTLRYWYQDEGLGTAGMVFEVDYASVGDSNAIKDKVQGKVVAASPPVAGADHYLEVSFTAATLSAKGATGSNDQLKFNGRLHNSGFQGTVDVTNDYSYNGGATGIDNKITLYQSGKLISGAEP